MDQLEQATEKIKNLQLAPRTWAQIAGPSPVAPSTQNPRSRVDGPVVTPMSGGRGGRGGYMRGGNRGGMVDHGRGRGRGRGRGTGQ